MKRDLDALVRTPHDMLVIGGGVYGAWIAYDAALRGLKVALIERHDWASGTSSASSKLIHGGLRYLERLDFGLVRTSLAERTRLLVRAPHQVRPLRFVLPVYAGARVPRWRLKLGLWLYDTLAGRATGIPAHRSLARELLLDRFDLEPYRLRGGFEFGDAQTDDARLVLEVVDGAIGAGAAAANYVGATALATAGGTVVGAHVLDSHSGDVAEVRADVTVCCAGAWSRELIGAVDPSVVPDVRLSKGVHLVLPPLPVDEGFLISSDDDSRIVFLIPWYGRTLLGTTDTDYQGDPGRVTVEPSDVAYLLERANRVLSGRPWTPLDVISSFAGVRTLIGGSGGAAPSAVSREWRMREPLDGLLLPLGGKYTSARADAARLVDRAVERLGRGAKQSPTASMDLPWKPREPFASWSREKLRVGLGLGLDEETALSCQSRFGARIDRVYEAIREFPELAHRVVADAPFCTAEVLHAVDHEMGRTLADVLRRRLPLLLVSRLDSARVEELAALVGWRLGWDEQRRRAEVRSVTPGTRHPEPVGEPA